MKCERCARPVAIIRIGPSAPLFCSVCCSLAQDEEEERALAGSPYETALKKDVKLDVVWYP